MGIFQRHNKRRITVIMVTHEPDIAAYARRNVVMRDGVVKTDRAVTQRFIATDEMEKLGRVEPEADEIQP